MAEHRIPKNNVIYVIPDDDLFLKYKSGKAFIDDYGRLINSETHRVIKELKHYGDKRPINVVNPVPPKKESPLKEHIKEELLYAGEELIDRGVDWLVYKAIPDAWHKHVVPFFNQTKDALMTNDIKAEKIVREIPEREIEVVTKTPKKKTMTSEEADLEKRKVIYHWLNMLISLKKLHDADEIDFDSVLAQLTDENVLRRVNGLLEENPNILETEKYITLHDLLGRDLYKDKQLIPIRGEEIVTLVEKYGQNSNQM